MSNLNSIANEQSISQVPKKQIDSLVKNLDNKNFLQKREEISSVSNEIKKFIHAEFEKIK